jgi:hypothetical protein
MTSHHARQSRFQFSLLALLILVTVVAAFLAGRASLRIQLLEAQSRAEQAESELQSVRAVADLMAENLRQSTADAPWGP